MNILNQINNYVEAFLKHNLNKNEQDLTAIQSPIILAIENSNPLELITIVSVLKPQIAYLQKELETRDLELASRKGKINAGDQEFEQMAQDRRISRGELLVKLGEEINSINKRKDITDYTCVALKSWVLLIERNISTKIDAMSDEEKNQLYSDLTNVIKQNESSIDLLGQEITHRELQTDEEIQATATRNGQTIYQVKGNLELEIMQNNLKISRLKEQNSVINDYKKTLIQTVAVAVRIAK